MKKNICLLATALLIATASLFTVSCTEEFQVEESQLYGKWYFPLTLATDSLTGFDWSGDSLIIKAPDSMWVQDRGMATSDAFIWTLRGNSVTATLTPRANVDEHYIIAFTVYSLDANNMQISGKYRYIYNGENVIRGDISSTLTRTDPHPQDEDE